jgi:hypothetical protein
LADYCCWSSNYEFIFFYQMGDFEHLMQ